MQAIVCIDDTDNLEIKRGTGELAHELKGLIEEHGWGKSDRIVRHQLFVHPDIPYTSHNSAMSFGLEVMDEADIAKIIAFAGAFLAKESLEGSDPGLCVAFLRRLSEPQRLLEFGRQAKEKVLTKDHAYQLAEELGIHLSEHGGTGQGVIGALAGVALRLSGNDGRVRGKHPITAPLNMVSIDELLRRDGIDLVQTVEGQILEGHELVRLEEIEKVKTVYLDGRSVLLVRKPKDGSTEVKWEVCPMEYLKKHY